MNGNTATSETAMNGKNTTSEQSTEEDTTAGLQTTPRRSRRQFLGLIGATTTSVGLAGCSAGDSTTPTNNSTTTRNNSMTPRNSSTTTTREPGHRWKTVTSPTAKTLYSVVTSAGSPFAVGSSGLVLRRQSDGWTTVVQHGPTGAGNTLRGAAVTSDGRNVWFAGGSGVVAQYDVKTEQLTDYSAPKGKTSTWEDIAVTGAAGAETVHLVNGSGEYLRGHRTRKGGMNWRTVIKPGGGSSMKGIAFVGLSIGYICDTNAKVYETTNGGKSWHTIGIEGGSVGLYDVSAVGRDAINAVGGDGSIFRYDGAVWTKLSAGSNALYAIDRRGTDGLASGGSGTIFDRMAGQWQREQTPTSAGLQGVVIGSNAPAVAVGSGGTILERTR